MKPPHAPGLMLVVSLASILGACHPLYDGFDTCPVPTRIQTDYHVLLKTIDAASYFPPNLYSTVPWWKGFEGEMSPHEPMDPNDNQLYRTALSLQGLGEESLYARRSEPGLHVYRVLLRSAFGGRLIWRAEERGPYAWVERRIGHSCKRRGAPLYSTHASDYGSNVDMLEKELPEATWLTIDGCMAEHFWAVPMVDGTPPTAAQPDDRLMTDGPPFCLFEGIRGGEYHAIRLECEYPRQAPSRDSPLACLAMMENAVR